MQDLLSRLGQLDDAIGAFLAANPKIKTAARAFGAVLVVALANYLGITAFLTDVFAETGVNP